jgi:hypothetical protein
MPRFLGLEVQTDVRCASGARVAFFPAAALVACSAVLSPTEPESLVATIQRSDLRAVEVVEGRVVRTCFSDTAYDREWDIVALADGDTDDQLTLTCQPIGLRLARKVYETADAATGAPVLDFTRVGVNASDAIDDYVLPTLAAKGMSWVARGTVDSTNVFDLSGQWASILEIVRAIAEPGRANAEWQLRRNGDSGYLLDLLDQIGGSAGTLRIRTAHNLLAHRRNRSVLEAVTRSIPRGMDAGAGRTMADHLWLVDSKGTDGIGNYIALSDILAGDDPIRYDDQGKDFYVGSLDTHNPTLQLVTATRAATQRVYMSSTAQFTAGKWCRFLVGSTVSGARVTSLTSPTAVLAPSAGGLGDIAEILDRPDVRADCNLVPNPWMRDWTTAASPPDGWTVGAGTPANVTDTRETTTIRESPYAQRLETTGATTLYMETPDIPVWAISGRRHFGAIWFYVDAVPAAVDSSVIVDLYTAAGVKIVELARWVRNTAELDQWLRVIPTVKDLSAVTGKVRIRVTIGTTSGGSAASGWNVIISNALLAESEIPIDDIEYSGATILWQEANRRLGEAAAAVRGQELQVADLEADDPDVFGSLLVTPGQDCELTDQVLGEITTQRVLEYRPDYLRPLESGIRVGIPALSNVKAIVPGGIEPADDDAERADLELAVIHGPTTGSIEYSGGPVVEQSPTGREPWTIAEPSPISVERLINIPQTRWFRARSSIPGDVTAPVPATVLGRAPTAPASVPDITGITITDTDTPNDGGGHIEFEPIEVNMPGGQTYDVRAERIAGSVLGTAVASASGLVSADFPYLLNLGLAPGDVVKVTISAFDGTDPLDSYDEDFTV